MSSREETPILEVPIAPPVAPPQLQALIATEVARQTEVLVGEIASLEATNATLVARLAALEASQQPAENGQAAGLHEEVVRLQDTLQEERKSHQKAVTILEDAITLRAQEIASDRRRIAALEVPPEVRMQPKQRNQGDILRALLASTANGKMLQSKARQKMGMSKSAFSQLFQTLEGSVKHEPYHRDRRQNVLILINKKA